MPGKIKKKWTMQVKNTNLIMALRECSWIVDRRKKEKNLDLIALLGEDIEEFPDINQLKPNARRIRARNTKLLFDQMRTAVMPKEEEKDEFSHHSSSECL